MVSTDDSHDSHDSSSTDDREDGPAARVNGGASPDRSGLEAWTAAVGELTPLLNGVGLLALLTGLARAGRLPDGAPAGVPEGAASPLDRIVREALEVGGVVGDSPGPWATAMTADGLVPPEALLAAWSARRRLLEALGEGVDYWSADPSLRRAVAQMVSPDPRLPAALTVMRSLHGVVPRWGRRAAGGGRYLELGCGLAGGLLTQLQLYPSLTGTGVELAEDLAAEARRRAEQVGVADRVEIVLGDATRFDRPDAYDLCFWSQFFFPGPSREAALGTAFRSLRSGGLLAAPVNERPADDADTDARLEWLLDTVMVTSWGVPERTADELADEVAAAGFTEVEVVRSPPWVLLQAVRP